jgi:Fe-S-cluster-containing dehydrogenase component/formate-dependent nitrite reductase membrane component NrfD
MTEPPAVHRWIKVLDQSRCIGCHACTTACRSENEVPLGVTRTYVKSVDVGVFPQVRRAFQVTRCNQCQDAPCVTACPTEAMYRRPDGLVDFDKSVCIGCKACIAACPYDAIFINPEDHSAEKCNFCAHRLDVGLEPACVSVCPTEAILIGDLGDPSSKAARIVQREPVAVRRPEKETRPGVFYRGAHQATLDPLGAERPPGGLLAWATQPNGGTWVPGGAAHGRNSSAAALLSYDIPHQAPWGWRVSLYTWTKSIATGAMLANLLLLLFSGAAWSAAIARYVAPLIALGLLAGTGLLLIWDLKHPLRFPLIFLRHQWRSWLVRGSIALLAYGIVVLLALIGGALDQRPLQQVTSVLAVPLAVVTACYTAYLFAQAKARDLWQSPLLPPHLFVQAVLAGAAALLPWAAATGESRATFLLQLMVAAAAAAHLLLVLGETTLTHGTAHAEMAVQDLLHGGTAPFFWASTALLLVAVASPWLGIVGCPLALLGLLAYEHAYVRAGQSVPLA